MTPAPSPENPAPSTLSVVLPTYNEVANIVPLVSQILEKVPGCGYLPQIVVVDDNSSDGTQEALRKAFGQDPRFKLVVRVGERGLASALWRGIQESSGQLVVTMDSDFNHHPRDLPKVLAALKGHDMAIGSRYVPGGGMNTSRLRFLLSHAFNIMLRLMLGVGTHDNLSGFLVAKRELWEDFGRQGVFQGYGDYAIRLLFLAQRQGLSLVEVPVVYENRLGGDSKTRFLHHFSMYFSTALKLRREFPR